MKAGLILQAPDGRRFQVCPETGCDSKGKPMVRLSRQDRHPWEQPSLWKPLSEVEIWMVCA